MGTWRGTGRRALAVGAGALLIGALGAGPAYAGTDNDDDEYTYVDDSCSDYHESWYFEHGYDYDEHWDDDWDHGDRWDKDHWDKDRWHQGDDWKKHWDDKDYYVKDGKVYDKKTNKPIFDLGTGLPIQLPIHDPLTAPDATSQGATDQQAPEQKKTKTEVAQPEVKTETKKPETETKQPETKTETKTEVVEPESVTPPAGTKKSSGTDLVPEKAPADTPTVTTDTSNKAVVTDLAATDPWDDKDKDKDRDRGKDRDRDEDWNKDRDHGWWDGWWEKESYSVNVSCYEDKETDHRWYDDRPVGEIDATDVKTVPTGGVDTGN